MQLKKRVKNVFLKKLLYVVPHVGWISANVAVLPVPRQRDILVSYIQRKVFKLFPLVPSHLRGSRFSVRNNVSTFTIILCCFLSIFAIQKKICLKLTKQYDTIHYSASVRQCVTSIYRPAYIYLPYYTDSLIVSPLKSDTSRIARQHAEPS